MDTLLEWLFSVSWLKKKNKQITLFPQLQNCNSTLQNSDILSLGSPDTVVKWTPEDTLEDLR